MTHPPAEQLSAFVDGELPELAEHIAGCANCQTEVGELRRVRDMLGSDPIRPSDAPSKAEWRAVAARIHRGRLLRRGGIAAGLLAAAAVAALLIGRPTPVYVHATDQLEAVLQQNRKRLRPETVQALERSLTVIDSALAQAEQALARDPANDYVMRAIDQLKNQRLATLRDAVALAQE